MKTTLCLSLIVCAALVAGCQQSTDLALPEVNQANCTPENIRSIPLPEGKKRQFATACATGGGYTSGPKKTY